MKHSLIFLIAWTCILISNAHANEPAHGEAEKPKVDAHGAPKSEGHEEAAPPLPVGPKREYNPGPVEPFPEEISGIDLKLGKTSKYKPKRGRATLVIFIASWCEPCQVLMPVIKNLAKKYDGIYTDVIYVFAHDTQEDAAGFAKEHKLTGRMFLANHEILKAFKNPPLPAIYIGDRYNYIGNRALKFTAEDVAKLDTYLSKLTVL